MESDKLSIGAHISLISAIDQGHAQVVKHFLQNGTEANGLGAKYEVPLQLAIEKGNLKICQILLEAGADASKGNAAGASSLHLAVKLSHTDITKLLLDNGANVNDGNNMGETPLHVAVNNRHQELSKLLLTNGADVNAARILGETPLIMAVSDNQLDLVMILLQSGADINKGNDLKQTPLHVAIAANHGQIFEALLERGADINLTESVDYNTPFFHAIKHNRVDMAKVLLTCGVDCNQPNSWGDPPLYIAIRDRKLDMAMLLVDRGAQLAGNDEENMESALIAAIMYMESDCALPLISLMLKQGANVNKASTSGHTPLYLALKLKKTDVAKHLIEIGADITDDCNTRKESATETASRYYETENINMAQLIILLLEKGTDSNETNAGSDSRLIMALSTPCSQFTRRSLVMFLLKEHADVNQTRANGDSPLCMAVRLNDLVIVEQLLHHGAEVNHACSYGGTALSHSLCATYSADHSDTSMVRMLLERGADANKAGVNGVLPLHQALLKYQNAIEFTEILLQEGADPNAADRKGGTSLLKTICPKLVKLLLTHGADANIASSNGLLPLAHVCASTGPRSYQLETIQVFLEHKNNETWSY